MERRDATLIIYYHFNPCFRHNQTSFLYIFCLINYLRPKKIPLVPVSYREKIRVGRSEINSFFEYFFHGFGCFLLGDLQL